ISNTQADFKRAIKSYAMKRGFEYAPTKCNEFKVTMKCHVADCPWRIKARHFPGLNQWWVKKFDSKHTCSRAIGGIGHWSYDKEFITSVIWEQVMANENYTPKMIQTEIQRSYDTRISYWKAYRTRERVLQMVHRDFEGSFAALLAYMRELRLGDANACVQLEYYHEGSFHRFFWAFGALFVHSGRTASRLLDWMYRGALLTASCIDENNYILPLAWAEGENRYSWHCFLEWMRDNIVANRELHGPNSVITFIFDCQKGLIKAVGDVFPEHTHGYWVYHLSTNLPHRSKNTPAWRRFWLLRVLTPPQNSMR
ncbi:hypothetical protein ACMD2_18105, partial [Ananas comosus]